MDASVRSRMPLLRRIGFALLAVVAIAVTVLAAPTTPEPVDTSNYERQIEVALADYEGNDALTQGAPQQAVVNGWIARDMLTIIAEQTNALLGASQASAGDPRVPLLLMLLVLAVAWHGLTAPTAAGSGAGGHAVDVAEPGAGFARTTSDDDALGAAIEDDAAAFTNQGTTGDTPPVAR